MEGHEHVVRAQVAYVLNPFKLFTSNTKGKTKIAAELQDLNYIPYKAAIEELRFIRHSAKKDKVCVT
jgi:hypothetical protein